MTLDVYQGGCSWTLPYHAILFLFELVARQVPKYFRSDWVVFKYDDPFDWLEELQSRLIHANCF